MDYDAVAESGRNPASKFGRNRTHDFLPSRCAGCLLLIDHSGDELYKAF